MTRLLCEPEDRIGASSQNRPSILTVRAASTMTIKDQFGLGGDGAGEIRGHAWFKGVDWESKPSSRRDMAFR